jgi:hypothetical protein
LLRRDLVPGGGSAMVTLQNHSPFSPARSISCHIGNRNIGGMAESRRGFSVAGEAVTDKGRWCTTR